MGFCEEYVELGTMVGEAKGSWAYYDLNGKIGAEGTKSEYGESYGRGDVIGCGMNFNKNIAFFTKNGTVIGKTHTHS